MKKVIISLSICVLIVGLCQIKSQTVSAEKTKEQVLNSNGLTNQADDSISMGKQTSFDDGTTLNTADTTDDSETKKDVLGRDVEKK